MLGFIGSKALTIRLLRVARKPIRTSTANIHIFSNTKYKFSAFFCNTFLKGPEATSLESATIIHIGANALYLIYMLTPLRRPALPYMNKNC